MIRADQSKERPDQFVLSSDEFSFICKLVYDHCGIVLDERKREMLYRRLMRRTRDLSINSFTDYCNLLKSPEGEVELPNFINAVTTNLTSFFREEHHFDYMKETFLPDMVRQSGDNKRLRIWSSACSTGEEPYSIAITLHEALGSSLAGWDAKILATDLDTDVLEACSNGLYRNQRIDDLDVERKRKWFSKGKGSQDGIVKVSDALKELITFKQLNLLERWPMTGSFDIIFCRNVLIYFDKATQARLITRYYDLLRPGGLLFLGHSESIAKGTLDYEFLGRTMFRKCGNARADGPLEGRN